jgi:hypothetical protein
MRVTPKNYYWVSGEIFQEGTGNLISFMSMKDIMGQNELDAREEAQECAQVEIEKYQKKHPWSGKYWFKISVVTLIE